MPAEMYTHAANLIYTYIYKYYILVVKIKVYIVLIHVSIHESIVLELNNANNNASYFVNIRCDDCLYYLVWFDYAAYTFKSPVLYSKQMVCLTRRHTKRNVLQQQTKS